MRKTTANTIAGLISSTIPDDQYNGVATPQGKWAVGTYNKDDIVYHDDTFPFLVHKCTAATTTTTEPGTDGAEWSSLGAIDAHRMFDIYLDTYTAATNYMEFEIDASNCDCVGFFRLQAKLVEIELIVDSTIYDSVSIDMDVSNITDWYEYHTAGFEYKENLAWYFDRYSNSKLKIKITYAATGEARCGTVAIGESKELGKTLKDPELSVDDFSIAEIDGLGTYLKEGTYSDIGDLEIIFPSYMADVVKRSLVASRGKAAIYDFNEPNDELYLEAMLFHGLPARYTIKPHKLTDNKMEFGTCTFSMRGTP
jgi:hypothetical protein